jgi:hypothetical protein
MSNKSYSKSSSNFNKGYASKGYPSKSYSKQSAVPDAKELAYRFIENLFAENLNKLVPFIVDGDTYYGAVEGIAVFNWDVMAKIVNGIDNGINSTEYIAMVLNKLCAYHAHELLALIVPLLKKYCDVDLKYPLLHEINYPAYNKRPIANLTRNASDAKMTASLIISVVGILPEFTNGRDHPEDAFASLDAAMGSKKIDAYSGAMLEMCYKFYSELAKSLRLYETTHGKFDKSFQTTILKKGRIIADPSTKTLSNKANLIVVDTSEQARDHNRCSRMLYFEDNYFHRAFSNEEETFNRMVRTNIECKYICA